MIRMAVELSVSYMKGRDQFLECRFVKGTPERCFGKEYINVPQLTVVSHFCAAHQRHILHADPLAGKNSLCLLLHGIVKGLHLVSVSLVVTLSEEAIQDVSIIRHHPAKGRKDRRVFGYIDPFHTEPFG